MDLAQRCDATWNAAIAAATMRVEAALVAAMRDGANPYEIRARATAALNALRHPPVAAGCQPPFTAG